MRFLVNENVPLDAITALREKTHDVLWIRTDAPGSSDEDILALGVAEERILITFDKDFGELAFHAHLPSKCGIILFRLQEKTSMQIAKIIVSAIESRSDWAGNFTVIEEHRIRMRPL
jgi:predicted nuclease of predicted toxin-antitoxin system